MVEHRSLGLFQFRIVQDPSPEDWNRVRRYASWMRGVLLTDHSVLGQGTLPKLRLNMPAGGWFPALQDLSWSITESKLTHVDLFFSPNLKNVLIYPPRYKAWAPHTILPAAASAISILPASALQSLIITDSGNHVLWEHLKDSFSSLILRCGSSLTELISPIPLTDAAINHLIRLPHLHTWRVGDPPPNYSASSLPSAFPPLTKFLLEKSAARGWISLFERIENHVSTTQGVTPLSEVKRSLKFLEIETHFSPILDASFASRIQIFHNLVSLTVDARCPKEHGAGQCIVKLSDDDITELAMALPQLEYLLLGDPCENTCATTAACLLPISVYCLKLKQLEIHFNTANIADDLEGALKGPRFQALRALPRCTLECLDVWRIPLTLDGPGFETVLNGLLDIFPSLKYCEGLWDAWEELNKRIEER